MMTLWKTWMAGAMAAVLFISANCKAETRLQGSGATFPGPIYAKWVEAYNKAHPDVKVDYQLKGSGAGIKAISDHTAIFAGSDAPMTSAQEKAAPAKILHLPTVAGPIVMAYNLPEVKGEINLDGSALADIYLGKITQWDDAKLKALNPNIDLPNTPISVVHRDDGSGTTYIFTNYLSKVSTEWKEKVGNATAVSWPVGQGGNHNDGVAAAVKNTEGSIGYIEFAYAVENKIPYATQINKDGKPVRASIEGVVEATSNSLASFPEDLKVSITDAPGEKSYPICGFTYLLVYEDLSYLKDKTAATALLDYINWCLTDGQDLAKDLGYARLPKEAQEKVLAKLKTIKFDGEPVLK
jgi:phosphate transport system substrate-binding protein